MSNIQNEVPDGWNRVKLGAVFKVKSGDFLPQEHMNSTGGYPVYGGNGINGYHNKFMFEEPKIVIGRVGAQCGCVHTSKPNSWITDNALYISEKLIEFDDEFMIYCLRYKNLNNSSFPL